MVLMPQNAAVHRSLASGITLQQQGKLKEAEVQFLRVLREDPNNAAALYSLAAICENKARLPEALRYISRATRVSPNFAQALLAKSIILLRLGRPTEALQEVESAMAIDPSLPGAAEHRASLAAVVQNLSPLPYPTETTPVSSEVAQAIQAALTLQANGQVGQAKQAFEEILSQSPDNFVALYSLGALSNQNGDPHTALGYLEKAVAANPANPMGHHALGTVQQALGLFEDALASLDAALSLQPDYREAFVNKCTVLHSMNRQADAVAAMNQALELFPDDPKILNNLGYLLTEFKQNAQAARFFKRLVDLDPYYENAQGLHAYARLHACDWTDYASNRDRILEGIEQGQRVCNPMALLALTDDPRLHQKCAIAFGKARFAAAPNSLWKGETYRHRRKRIAFLSADFREHPVGYLLIALVEKLPSMGYETVGVSFGSDDQSLLYKRYRQAFTHYLSCQDKSAFEVASILRSFEVDVAIDLTGYTSGSRLEVLAHRPCPIQATYLGYPGTLGLPYIDYLIADYFIVPNEQEQYFSERVIKLPHSYLPRDSSVIASPTTPSRREFGLPEDGLVFCSFNHDYKINPPLFAVWMRLLNSHPGSVLWLMKLNDDARGNLVREAAAQGVGEERLIFASRVPRVEDHLARYRHADLFLDTFPYGGHTTASDALLMGTPVVTLAGRSFASRVAGCMLTDLGLTNGIASSMDEYFNIAQSMIDSPTPSPRVGNAFPSAEQLAEAFSNCIERMS